MAIDEYIYAKVSSYFNKKSKLDAEVAVRIVYLDNVRDKLTIFSRAITGQAIDIFNAEREGGYKNNSFFLPTHMTLFKTVVQNEEFYVFRVLYLYIQHKLQLNASKESLSLLEAQNEAKLISTQVLSELFFEFPETEHWYHELYSQLENIKPKNSSVDTTWLYGKLMFNSIDRGSIHELENYTTQAKIVESVKPKTTILSKSTEEVISIEVDKKQQEDYVLTHNFEKVDTAEEFDGVWRDFDGDDDLKDHEEALDELNLKYTVRVEDMAHSVYQADFIENTTISESKESNKQGYFVSYDEWDYSKFKYKKDFCKVYPQTQSVTDIKYYNKTIGSNTSILTGLRKMLVNVNNKLQQQHRQVQGDEFDIDAITDLFVDVKCKSTPSENIYISKRKKEKSLSLLLLLDISLSSDGYSNGNRIIDIEKEVAILFGEILDEFNVDFSIDCFYSQTRNYSSYITLKGFDESWNIGKMKIGAIEPCGFTRIGSALRHSGNLLDQRNTQNKWIVLLSDGKPNDYDKYEGKYGINDVKQTLLELNSRQINTFALAVEAEAKYYLPQMFGQNHYQIISSTHEILMALVKLFEKIKYK